MPNTTISNSRGLVQRSGSGFQVTNGVDVYQGVSNLAIGGGVPLALLAKRQEVTIGDASTTKATTGDFIPAGAMVVAASIAVVTASAGGNAFDITDFGLDGDADFFNAVGGATLDGNTAGGALMGFPDPAQTASGQPQPGGYFALADEAMITFGNSGAQVTDGVVSITIYYYDLSVNSATK